MKKINYGKYQEPTAFTEPVDPEHFKEKMRLRLGDLDTIPFVYRKLLSLLNSPFVSARELGKVISTDQSLSLRVLRMANSASYGVTQRVMSVTQAVNMLGLNVVRSLCFCLASYDSFFTGPGDDQAQAWARSMGTGLTAKHLAYAAGLNCPEELFVAGMLHDIGNSVLKKFAPREHAALMERLADADDPAAAELEYLGLDRSELGAFTCETWRLPELLVACVRHVNQPELAGPQQRHATLIAMARQGWGNRVFATDDWNQEHLSYLGLEEAEVLAAAETAESEFRELGSYVGLRSRAS